MMKELIESEQSTINSLLNTTKEPTYNNIIIPSLDKLIDAILSNRDNLSSLPMKTVLSKPIDIYGEALTVLLIREPYIILPIRLITFVLINHPFMLNVIQCKHNQESWEVLRQQIIESIDNDYSSIPQAKQLKQLLSQQTLDQRLCSSFHLFHYLMGFYFKPETTGKTGEELKPIIHQLMSSGIIISINASYNINRKDSIVVYQDVPRSNTKILNESTIDKFNSFYYSPVRQTVNTAYDILDANTFKKLERIPKDYKQSLVLISYNDDNNLQTNHYTIAHYGKTSTLDYKLTQEFISFKAIRTISPKLLSYYIQESFYESIYTNELTIENLKRSYTQLMNTISSTFNTTNNPAEFINKLVDEVKHNYTELIPNEELKWFRFYLSKLNRINPYNLSSVLEYTLAYIYPDLLANSSDL